MLSHWPRLACASATATTLPAWVGAWNPAIRHLAICVPDVAVGGVVPVYPPPEQGEAAALAWLDGRGQLTGDWVSPQVAAMQSPLALAV